MRSAELNITQAELGRMGSGARGADHALERALNDGELPLGIHVRLLTIRSLVQTALGQVKDAQAIVHELKNGDCEP